MNGGKGPEFLRPEKVVSLKDWFLLAVWLIVYRLLLLGFAMIRRLERGSNVSKTADPSDGK